MKKLISIALILLMSIQCFYKLGVLGYYHLNQKYISENLCVNKEKAGSSCHGQCFLKKKLAISGEGQKLPASENRGQIELVIFLISQCEFALNTPSAVITEKSNYRNAYIFEFHKILFHPPCIG